MWFGYARIELMPFDVRSAIPQKIHEYAMQHEFGDGTVIFEPIAAEILLRDLLAELDRRSPAADVMARLRHLAQSFGVDLGQVFNPSRRCEALWQITDLFEGSIDAHLIVPSREHLADLGPSGRGAVALLTRSSTVTVHYLDSIAEVGAERPDRLPIAAYRDAQVLVESRIGAIPTVVQLDAATELSRLGRAEIIESVDAVYLAMINQADAARAADDLEFPSATDPAVIRLLETSTGRLIVELEEPHPRMDAIRASLTELCESTERFVDNGRTFTRCVLRIDPPPSGIVREGRE